MLELTYLMLNLNVVFWMILGDTGMVVSNNWACTHVITVMSTWSQHVTFLCSLLSQDNIQILRDLSLLQIQMRDLEGYRVSSHFLGRRNQLPLLGVFTMYSIYATECKKFIAWSTLSVASSVCSFTITSTFSNSCGCSLDSASCEACFYFNWTLSLFTLAEGRSEVHSCFSFTL